MTPQAFVQAQFWPWDTGATDADPWEPQELFSSQFLCTYMASVSALSLATSFLSLQKPPSGFSKGMPEDMPPAVLRVSRFRQISTAAWQPQHRFEKNWMIQAHQTSTSGPGNWGGGNRAACQALWEKNLWERNSEQMLYKEVQRKVKAIAGPSLPSPLPTQGRGSHVTNHTS